MTPQLERLKGIAISAACKSPKKPNPKKFEDIAIFMHELTPAVVVGLFAEIERLETSRSKKERELEQELEVWHHGPFCWTCGDTGDVHDITGEWRGECDCLSAQLINSSRERDQLKAENEALRKALGEISGQVDGNIRCAVRDVVNGLPDVQDIYGYCDNIDEIIEAAMAKEVSHD